MNEQETIQEKAILVGCQLPHITDEHFENSMEELASLSYSADGTVLTSVRQNRYRAD
ncbi:GTPase HflX, partial [Bacillus subtilis]